MSKLVHYMKSAQKVINDLQRNKKKTSFTRRIKTEERKETDIIIRPWKHIFNNTKYNNAISLYLGPCSKKCLNITTEYNNRRGFLSLGLF